MLRRGVISIKKRDNDLATHNLYLDEDARKIRETEWLKRAIKDIGRIRGEIY